MKKYCFMMTGNDVWLKVAIHLFEKNIAKPVLWLGDDVHFDKAKKIFGNHVLRMDDFVHYQQAIQKIEYCGENIGFFSSPNYLRAKDRCLKMMDRLDLYGSFSRQDREVVYNKLAMSLLKKIDASKPDALVMAEHAHSHAQYLVLEICMYLDIEIVKFNNWMIAPLLYLHNLKTGERLDAGFKTDNEISVNIEANIKNYVNSVLEKKDEDNFELEYMKNQRLRLSFGFIFTDFFSGSWLGLLKEAWFQSKKIRSNSYYQINPYRHGIFIKSKIKRLRRKSLKKELQIKKDSLDFTKKYVYFGLHFEPERTSNPDAGEFHDQALAIIALRDYLPNDIGIIVKEHPSQFYMYDRGSRGRSPLFYDLIKNLSGVQLAHHQESTIKLIKRSEFVSTLAGTLALEASILGKKSIIFGDSWFDGCPNVIAWKDRPSFDGILKQEVSIPSNILSFLLEQKELKTVIGCQNPSAQNAHKKYLDYKEFSNEEYEGVLHLLKNFFIKLNSNKS